ncbi:MAG: MFS transporter [Candidatus Moranbacteria bacterium]|nr:MFS transporter [Candidatus Moranbacteria bacterium]
MKISPNTRKKLVFFSFLLIDFFATVDIGATTVAAPKIVEYFGVAKNLTTWVVNTDLIALSVSLIILLVLSGRIKRRDREKYLLIEGLVYFIVGCALCYFANSSELFFFGLAVKGFGKGMLFVGQMWAMTKSFKEKIIIPLVWSEIGFVGGVIFGPIIGGLFSGLYPGSWKLIFLASFFTGLLTLAIFAFFYKQRSEDGFFLDTAHKKLGVIFWSIMACELVISIVSLGLEFMISVYFQNYRSFTPFAVGMILLCSSLGIISGSGWALKRNNVGISSMQRNLIYLSIVTLLIGPVLAIGNNVVLVFLLFGEGFFYGLLSVINYAYLSKIMPSRLVVRGAIIYIFVANFGSAIGVQMETLWQVSKGNFMIVSVTMAILIQIVLFFLVKNQSNRIFDAEETN